MGEIRKAISLVEMVESLLATSIRTGSTASLPLEGMQLSLEQVRRLLANAALDSELLTDDLVDLPPVSVAPRRVTLAERVRMVPQSAVSQADEGFVRELAPQPPKRRAVG